MAGPLLRLFRLWRLYAYMDFLWVTRDLKATLIWYGSDLIANAAAVSAMLLLAERFGGIGAWSKFQIVFMLGYATVVSGILDTMFNYNVLYISRRLGRGQWDHTMVQPQPLWMALLTEGFAPFSGSTVILPGLAFMIWGAIRLSLPVTPAWLAMVALNLAASAAIVFAFTFLWGSLAFWAPRAAEEINSSSIRLLYQLKTFPLDGLGPGLLGGLMSILPVGFVAWYPCRSLLGVGPAAGSGAITPLVAVLFAAAAAWVFQQGMRHYGRTGSQRYLTFGHRR